jgi:hypothetical protein
LFDGEGGGEAVDRLNSGLRELAERAAIADGEPLHEPPLPLSVEGIECQCRLARPTHTGHDSQFPFGDFKIKTL